MFLPRMENMSQINQIIFQPFGAGPRNCIGKRFAILEIKVAMTRILQNFSIEPTEDTPVSIILACMYQSIGIL